MSNRKRVIYQSQALYAGPSPASGTHIHPSGAASGNYTNELYRVQSASYAFNVARQDVNQFGQLAAIDRIILESPTVSLDFNYLLTDGTNETGIGLDIGGAVSTISGILTNVTDERNYFILTTPEGTDAVSNVAETSRTTVGVGNGFLSNYTAEAAVGGLPTASVTVEALNMKIDPGSSGYAIPAVNPENGLAVEGVDYVLPIALQGTGQPSALQPGDVTLTLNTPFGAKVTDQYSEGTAHIQTFSLQVPIAREPLQRLGSKFAFSREITFPVTVSLNVTANVAELHSGSLADMICADTANDLTVTLREPSCTGTGPISLLYTLKNAKLDSQTFNSSIGANQTVDLVWSAQIGGPEDTDNGLFISGSAT